MCQLPRLLLEMNPAHPHTPFFRRHLFMLVLDSNETPTKNVSSPDLAPNESDPSLIEALCFRMFQNYPPIRYHLIKTDIFLAVVGSHLLFFEF